MNNEPAFPRPFSGKKEFAQEGMTLRDYFAAKVMQKRDWYFYVGQKETEQSLQNDARRCYEIADAMMKARGTK
jgi:hypothetical protein